MLAPCQRHGLGFLSRRSGVTAGETAHFFMGTQKINSNPNANAGQYQFTPQIKNIDPNQVPAGGISLQPFPSEQGEVRGIKGATTAALQNVYALQKTAAENYNKQLIQQQQQVIDAENKKIAEQNQKLINQPKNIAKPAKYSASPNATKGPPVQNYAKGAKYLNRAGQQPAQKSPLESSLFTAPINRM